MCAYSLINGDSAVLRLQTQAILIAYFDQSLETISDHDALLRSRVLQKDSLLQRVADCVSRGRTTKNQSLYAEAAALQSHADVCDVNEPLCADKISSLRGVALEAVMEHARRPPPGAMALAANPDVLEARDAAVGKKKSKKKRGSGDSTSGPGGAGVAPGPPSSTKIAELNASILQSQAHQADLNKQLRAETAKLRASVAKSAADEASHAESMSRALASEEVGLVAAGPLATAETTAFKQRMAFEKAEAEAKEESRLSCRHVFISCAQAVVADLESRCEWVAVGKLEEATDWVVAQSDLVAESPDRAGSPTPSGPHVDYLVQAFRDWGPKVTLTASPPLEAFNAAIGFALGGCYQLSGVVSNASQDGGVGWSRVAARLPPKGKGGSGRGGRVRGGKVVATPPRPPPLRFKLPFTYEVGSVPPGENPYVDRRVLALLPRNHGTFGFGSSWIKVEMGASPLLQVTGSGDSGSVRYVSPRMNLFPHRLNPDVEVAFNDGGLGDITRHYPAARQGNNPRGKDVSEKIFAIHGGRPLHYGGPNFTGIFIGTYDMMTRLFNNSGWHHRICTSMLEAIAIIVAIFHGQVAIAAVIALLRVALGLSDVQELALNALIPLVAKRHEPKTLESKKKVRDPLIAPILDRVARGLPLLSAEESAGLPSRVLGVTSAGGHPVGRGNHAQRALAPVDDVKDAAGLSTTGLPDASIQGRLNGPTPKPCTGGTLASSPDPELALTPASASPGVTAEQPTMPALPAGHAASPSPPTPVGTALGVSGGGPPRSFAGLSGGAPPDAVTFVPADDESGVSPGAASACSLHGSTAHVDEAPAPEAAVEPCFDLANPADTAPTPPYSPIESSSDRDEDPDIFEPTGSSSNLSIDEMISFLRSEGVISPSRHVVLSKVRVQFAQHIASKSRLPARLTPNAGGRGTAPSDVSVTKVVATCNAPEGDAVAEAMEAVGAVEFALAASGHHGSRRLDYRFDAVSTFGAGPLPASRAAPPELKEPEEQDEQDVDEEPSTMSSVGLGLDEGCRLESVTSGSQRATRSTLSLPPSPAIGPPPMGTDDVGRLSTREVRAALASRGLDTWGSDIQRADRLATSLAATSRA